MMVVVNPMKDDWVSAPYEFSGLMLAPDKEYIESFYKGSTLTFEGEPEPSACGWFWFRFTGVGLIAP